MKIKEDRVLSASSPGASNAAVSFSERDMRKILRCECLFEKVASSAEIGTHRAYFRFRGRVGP
jgi:hypothetical protein